MPLCLSNLSRLIFKTLVISIRVFISAGQEYSAIFTCVHIWSRQFESPPTLGAPQQFQFVENKWIRARLLHRKGLPFMTLLMSAYSSSLFVFKVNNKGQTILSGHDYSATLGLPKALSSSTGVAGLYLRRIP